ncbi:flippase [Shimia sp. MMG029]|uniref:flippase n=1 Tax=Shimia sp. MMG029 TaxID=3021978 RepID=UPI0022FDF6D7|nr:flippase [Shimia sp. MMG029]MDA5556953.1 flippase [Shimia sp. MMG029]
MLKRISINASWLILEKAVRAFSTLFVGAWVIQHLGAERFGHIAYAIVFVSFFQAIANLGIEGNFIREIVHSKNPDKRNTSIGSYRLLDEDDFKTETLVSSVLLLRLFTGLALYLLLLVINGLLTDWEARSLQITALIGFILIFQAADTIDLFNQSELASKRTAIAKIVSYVFSNGFRIVLIYIDADLIYFAAAYFIEALSIAAILTYYYKVRNSWSFKPGSIFRYFVFFISETWPVIVAAVATALATRMDQFLLNFYLGEEQIGLYSAAILFGSATFFLPAIICGSAMSTATELKLQDEVEYRSILRKVYVLNVSMAFCVAIATYVFAELVVLSFYGPEFSESANALKIYAILNIPVYIGITHSLWIVNDRKLHFLLYRALIGAVLTIVFCLFLIPVYGMIGAAVSILISQCVSEILVPYLLNRTQFNQILMRV